MTSQQDAPRRFLVALTFDMPAGQQHELAAQGRVETNYISADRSHVWLVMRGDGPDDIAQELTSFPLYTYMRPSITALLP
jgi:muconolactone delta-isomerase